MTERIRLIVLHRHSLFRDLVLQALAPEERVDVVGTTDCHAEANRWVVDKAATAAIVEVDPGFASRDDVRTLFDQWSRERIVAVACGGFSGRGIDVYVDEAGSGDAASAGALLSAALS
jgi:DNA-binding NarL/FixJ family response regulator